MAALTAEPPGTLPTAPRRLPHSSGTNFLGGEADDLLPQELAVRALHLQPAAAEHWPGWRLCSCVAIPFMDRHIGDDHAQRHLELGVPAQAVASVMRILRGRALRGQ
jgi:hypothetical protein